MMEYGKATEDAEFMAAEIRRLREENEAMALYAEAMPNVERDIANATAHDLRVAEKEIERLNAQVNKLMEARQQDKEEIHKLRMAYIDAKSKMVY
jgi:KaiC/GvpD/RAD55 family RecA-like ATPase